MCPRGEKRRKVRAMVAGRRVTRVGTCALDGGTCGANIEQGFLEEAGL